VLAVVFYIAPSRSRFPLHTGRDRGRAPLSTAVSLSSLSLVGYMLTCCSLLDGKQISYILYMQGLNAVYQAAVGNDPHMTRFVSVLALALPAGLAKPSSKWYYMEWIAVQRVICVTV
jgi:hypothetical protein